MLLPALYRRLLVLYPANFREAYGEEMRWVFQQAHSEIREESALVLVAFCAREMQGLVVGAVRERVRERFGLFSPVTGKGGSMESKFRFPRATLILMLLSLLGVVLSLEEARLVEIHYGGVSVPPEWPMLLWIFGQLLLIALAVAAMVCGLLFALRRTGIQRLES